MSNIYLNVLTYLILFTLYYVILNYVLYLEDIKCCSDDWRRNYIKYYSLITIIGLPLKLLSKYKDKINIVKYFMIIELLGGTLFIYALYTYSRDLKRNKPRCDCSKNSVREFIYSYSKLIIIIYSIVFFATLIALIQLKVIHLSIFHKMNKFPFSKLQKIKK
jgi:hypothetical protein